MKTIYWIALTLTVLGAINWGLWGIFQLDLVAAMFGGHTTNGARLVYSLIGVSGIFALGSSFALANENRAIGVPHTRSSMPIRR
jgi:uncharacterized membrane protein YuzA (DUF378 family)